MQSGLVFEDYRGHYIISTFTDTHFMLIWLVTLTAILSLYFVLQKFSVRRLILACCLYAAVSFLHIYEAVTLITITSAVTLLCWRKGYSVRPALATMASSTLAAALCFIWLLSFQRSSGLPAPYWRTDGIFFSILLISYPLAWILIIWGISEYWGKAGLKECFLLGWILGCTLLTLSGPFNPYPDRGLMTLQIPLYIVAGAIYFSRHRRVGLTAALIVVLILGATPAWRLAKTWNTTRFDPEAPYMYMNVHHRKILNSLQQQATEGDILMVDKSYPFWKTDDLWLAPEYPGKLYCGHFFLTVKYERKRAQVIRFFEMSSPEEQARFLGRENIRFLYVDAKKDLQHFKKIPGLILVRTTPVGYLFEYIDGAPDEPQQADTQASGSG
jgi:hypothetical protein